MNLDLKVEYIFGSEGTKKIIELGAMSSPVLVINNQIVMSGYTSNKDFIKKIINKFKDKE